jgi:hypothetical protein
MAEQHGGHICPLLAEERVCKDDPCPLNCVTSTWTSWSTCTKTCATGAQSRSRSIVTPAAHGGSCPELQASRTCNTARCPERHHCVYLKCRYAKNALGKYAIQVYHHHKDSSAVHHCKLYETEEGATSCQCSCWYHGEVPQ